MRPRNFIAIPELQKYLDQVASHTQPYDVDVNGLSIRINPPHVMSPRYDHAPHFMAKVISNMDFTGQDVLEIGTGSGVLSVQAANQNAKNIVAIDINPHAVANARENFNRHAVKGEVRQGDVYEPVKSGEKFDTVIFEAPYHDLKPSNWLEMGVSDEGYRTMRKFIENADSMIKPGGHMVIGFSSSEGDYDMLQKLLRENGWEVCQRVTEKAHGIDWDATIVHRVNDNMPCTGPVKMETNQAEHITVTRNKGGGSILPKPPGR